MEIIYTYTHPEETKTLLQSLKFSKIFFVYDQNLPYSFSQFPLKLGLKCGETCKDLASLTSLWEKNDGG